MAALAPERIVRLEADAVVLLDQRRLPDEEVELVCATAAEVAEAIRTLAVRGAPAIGIAAAYGLRARGRARRGPRGRRASSRARGRRRSTSPGRSTRMRAEPGDLDAAARRIHDEEVERCRRMAAHAADLLAPGTRALTHCNAGGLATGGYGTAVGALRAAWERGLLAHVLVDETRPLLQGARLTAWELGSSASRTR